MISLDSWGLLHATFRTSTASQKLVALTHLLSLRTRTDNVKSCHHGQHFKHFNIPFNAIDTRWQRDTYPHRLSAFTLTPRFFASVSQSGNVLYQHYSLGAYAMAQLGILLLCNFHQPEISSHCKFIAKLFTLTIMVALQPAYALTIDKCPVSYFHTSHST